MLIVSSALSYIPMPSMTSYSSTKAFVSNLGECLHYELKEKIDVLVWNPGQIATNISQKNMPT
jgi:short-subunit dehydrogenase